MQNKTNDLLLQILAIGIFVMMILSICLSVPDDPELSRKAEKRGQHHYFLAGVDNEKR